MSRDLTDALARLSETGRQKPTDQPQPRGAARRVVAAATPTPGTGGGGGSGEVESLTEFDVTQREYWTAGWRTTDGIFLLPAIKKIVTTNNDGGAVTLNFANPAP